MKRIPSCASKEKKSCIVQKKEKKDKKKKCRCLFLVLFIVLSPGKFVISDNMFAHNQHSFRESHDLC